MGHSRCAEVPLGHLKCAARFRPLDFSALFVFFTILRVYERRVVRSVVARGSSLPLFFISQEKGGDGIPTIISEESKPGIQTPRPVSAPPTPAKASDPQITRQHVCIYDPTDDTIHEESDKLYIQFYTIGHWERKNGF